MKKIGTGIHTLSKSGFLKNCYMHRRSGKMGIRIGIDTGGTFTDLVAIDENSQDLITYKTASTPQKPVQALESVIAESGLEIAEVSGILIGSTVATNAVITRTGSNVLLITTKGTKDILFIQRINRKYHYNLNWRKPHPLVKRRNIVEVDERLDSKGGVVKPLTEEALGEMEKHIRDIMAREAIDAFAVCTLFCYLNPEHELKIKAYLQRHFPDVPVSLSHQVSPIWREYERGCTVVANAYIAPIARSYVSAAESALSKLDLDCPISMVKSNGGMERLEVVVERPINILLSGLAGGIIAGKYFGEITGNPNAITLDMGGTSCDIGLVSGGKIGYTTNFELEWGHPFSTPVIDVTTIGAGGGSVGWRDKGGFLRVGPQSAGAEPGPACYDKGGCEPTVTDANLVLGRINPDYFLKGKMKLKLENAQKTIADMGKQLNMSMNETAVSIVRIANENMAGQINLLTVDKGLDPRGYCLVAFGGAGPLHGAAIARSLKLGKVIVPINPGMCSALGSLIADMQVDKVSTCAMRSDTLDPEEVRQRLTEMSQDARQELFQEGYSGTPIVNMSISMRYLDQNYEQDIPVPEQFMSGDDTKSIFDHFHKNHEKFYGYCFPDNIIELIHLNVSAFGKVEFAGLKEIEGNTAHDPKAFRRVLLDDVTEHDCPIYERDNLGSHCRIQGPAVIEEPASTTFIDRGDRLEVDQYGNLILHVAQ
jgi:N-methylhydantoinase A